MTSDSSPKRPGLLRSIFILFLGWVFLLSSTLAATEQVTYLHTDISGSPIAATDSTGNVLWRESYRGYGERWLNQPASYHQDSWFHGKELDATGLQYFGARYYDPAVGRFTGIDPVGFQDGNLHSFNRYAYGNNNPVKYLDPDGNLSVTAIAGFALVGIGAIWYSSQPQENRERMGRQFGKIFDGSNSSTIFPETGNLSSSIVNTTRPLPDIFVGSPTPGLSHDTNPGSAKGKQTNGSLRPDQGGNGDWRHDLDLLTGGTARPSGPSDNLQSGSFVGDNGIFARPKNSKGGVTIDIPSNGKGRKHEALHYPKPEMGPNDGPQKP